MVALILQRNFKLEVTRINSRLGNFIHLGNLMLMESGKKLAFFKHTPFQVDVTVPLSVKRKCLAVADIWGTEEIFQNCPELCFSSCWHLSVSDNIDDFSANLCGQLWC